MPVLTHCLQGNAGVAGANVALSGAVTAVAKKAIGNGGFLIPIGGFDLIPLPGTSVTTASYFTGANPGKIFSNAITAAVTTTLAGNTAPASSVVVTICYQ